MHFYRRHTSVQFYFSPALPYTGRRGFSWMTGNPSLPIWKRWKQIKKAKIHNNGGQMDTKVKKYFEKQEDSKRNICLRLREIILSTFPGISEELKWGVPVYGGGKIYIGEVRLGVNLGFSMEGLTEKEMENFSGKGKMMRHIKIMNPDEIEKEKIVRLLKLIK